MAKEVKTNAMRILEKQNIPFKSHTYDDDGEHKLELGAAERTAQKLGIPVEQVYKTIVMRSDTRQIYVFCQAANCEINLKKARAVVGCKELASVKPEELMNLTGYIRGGCSPLGMKKQYPTYIDEMAQLHDKIYISAGQRGVQISLNPEDLAKAVNAEFVDLAL